MLYFCLPLCLSVFYATRHDRRTEGKSSGEDVIRVVARAHPYLLLQHDIKGNYPSRIKLFLCSRNKLRPSRTFVLTLLASLHCFLSLPLSVPYCFCQPVQMEGKWKRKKKTESVAVILHLSCKEDTKRRSNTLITREDVVTNGDVRKKSPLLCVPLASLRVLPHPFFV